jgi:DNA-directed RNA polymerase subunit E'/Rpb7
MDPLFERRQLVKKVHIQSKFLQKNIQSSLLLQLKQNYEGRCIPEGFIQPNSITIVNYSLGRTNYIKGGIDYDVTFQGDICMPHIGQRFKAPVRLRTKIGIHAETPPIKVLIPRDLHLGSKDFEEVNLEDDIEFEVVGSQFKQEDENIIVVGKLLSKVAPPAEAPLITTSEQSEEIKSNTVPKSEQGEEKRVVIAPTTNQEQPKKRRLRRTEGGNNNEQFHSLKEGMVEGTA